MLYVPDLKVNFLSVASFEDDGYIITFWNGRLPAYSREVTPDMTIILGIRKERLYGLLGRPIVWYNSYLDSTSDSASTIEALSKVESYKTSPSTLGRMSS
jgi:hypothetical protein